MIEEKDLLNYCEINNAIMDTPKKGPMYITYDGQFIWVLRIGDMHSELFYFYEQDNDIDGDWDEDMTDFEQDYNWIRLNDGGTSHEKRTYFCCFRQPSNIQAEKIIDWLYYLITIGRKEVQFFDLKGDKSAIFNLSKRLPEEIINALRVYYTTGVLVENKELTEDTRTQFVSKSRNADNYKHNIRGKNRFERKKYSHVANQVKSYNTIDMNKFFKQDLLEVVVPVTGETDNYDVTLQLTGVVSEIARNIKSNKNKFEYRTIIQAITKIFNTTNIKVKCTCKDYEMRYAHNLIINNNSVDDTAHDPGPGKTGMTAQMKGQGCKHILLVLANQDWIMKVASCIKNYITYMDENKHGLFMKAIFPRLYSFDTASAAQNGLVPEDTNFETDKGIITIINDWAKNRGKIQKGSNKNPVAQAQREKEAASAKQETKPVANQAKPAEKEEKK